MVPVFHDTYMLHNAATFILLSACEKYLNALPELHIVSGSWEEMWSVLEMWLAIRMWSVLEM